MASPDHVDPRFDRAPCGLLTTTAAGAVVEANETLARWLGRPREELNGLRFTALLEPSSRLFFETRHAQVLHLEGSVNEVALSMLAADGTSVPILLSSVLDTDGDAPVVRTAVFRATDRMAYEKELVRARRIAEYSEARVRILQDISGEFGSSANDQEVAQSFVRVARDAFAASEAAVELIDENGELQLVAGNNPLWGIVSPIPSLRQTLSEVVLSADDVETDLPQLAQGLRQSHFEALSVTPLVSDGERLGVLVCFFVRVRDFDEDFRELQRALGRQASQTLVRVRLQRRLEHLALYDALTGVPNRQFVEQSLTEAIVHAKDAASPLSVIFIDVDEFKSVNDTLGHATGDEVLRTLAQRLRASVRTVDIVGRIGGDEFIAICANADAAAAAAIADRILTNSRDIVEAAAGVVTVSVSIGLAVFDPRVDESPTADQLLIRADGAMYASKGSGKDRVSLETRDSSL